MQTKDNTVFTQKLHFSVGKEILVGNIIAKCEANTPRVLFLHGGGESTKERTGYLAVNLVEKGIASFSFDFSGQGESTGSLKDSSLKKRVEEANAAMQFLSKDQPISIIGSSMGAHIALELLRKSDVKNLVLFCPAIYDKKALNVKFGDGFTEVIRKEGNWKNADVHAPLKRYKGDLLIIIGEDDGVIPTGVIELLDKHSKNVRRKEIITIPNCPHTIHTFLSSHEKLANKVTDKVAEFIRGKQLSLKAYL